jgi:hypothetical protein
MKLDRRFLSMTAESSGGLRVHRSHAVEQPDHSGFCRGLAEAANGGKIYQFGNSATLRISALQALFKLPLLGRFDGTGP